jgi:hypothetical protein
MKRIIRLTESDLTRIVKRVLKESKKPKSITIEFLRKWKNKFKEMRSDNNRGFTAYNRKLELTENRWFKVGTGPYIDFGIQKGTQSFYFAEYVPDNNEILVHVIKCAGYDIINDFKEKDEGNVGWFANKLENYGDVNKKDKNGEPYFCVHAKQIDCKFKDGFEVGMEDDRGYFQIVNTSEPKESEEEPLSERYYRRKI